MFAVPRLRPLTEGSSVNGIAVHAEQRAARLVLRLPPLGPRVAGAVIDMAVPDAEHRDVALAVEGDVAGVLRRLRILRIGADPVEHSIDVGRQRAFDFAIVEVDLGAVVGAGRPARKGASVAREIDLRRGTASCSQCRTRGSHADQRRAGAQRCRPEEIPPPDLRPAHLVRHRSLSKVRPLSDSPDHCNFNYS